MCFRATTPIVAGLSVYNMESGTGPPLYVFWYIMDWMVYHGLVLLDVVLWLMDWMMMME